MRSRRYQPTALDYVKAIGDRVLYALGGLMIGWMIVNAMMGCGDVTRTIDGTYIAGHCWLVPWHVVPTVPVDMSIYE